MGSLLLRKTKPIFVIIMSFCTVRGLIFLWRAMMKLNKFTVSYEEQDMRFLKKYGLLKANFMVFKHYKKYDMPFINDTYQLAGCLCMPRKEIFKMSKNAEKFYKQIELPKKNGGVRKINAPNAYLKKAQKQILNKILSNAKISPFATAYIKGKNLKDNASPHTNHKYLLKMDITDFFGSITYLQVISSAFNSNIYPVQIGAILTSLCCLNDVLPQGAPTSPMLSNIVMKNFDDIIGNWCKERNITYTRYCDDLTFSADKPLYNVYIKVKDMLEKRGFEINQSKTKFITNASSQRVTGLTVNEKVSIPSEYKRSLRQEVYYVLKFGLPDAILKGKRHDFMKNDKLRITSYYNHLKGKINYVLQIEPQNNWFVEALKRLDVIYFEEFM